MNLNPWTGLPEVLDQVPTSQQGRGPLLPTPVPGPVQQPHSLASKKVQSQVTRAPAFAEPEAPKAKSLIDMVQESLTRREQEAQMLKAQAAKPAEGGWADINLKPLLALADSWNGTNVAQSYENPALKKEQLRQQLMGQAIKVDESASNDRLALAKMMGDDQYKDRRMDNLELLTAITGASKDRALDIAEGRGEREKAPTGEAWKAGGFARRLEQTGMVLEDLAKKNYFGPSRKDQVRSFLPGEAQDENWKSYEQTITNFINATLRRESGAAIAPSEFDNARRQYLPQYGDTPEILAQKQANRAQVFENFKAEGGKAYRDIPLVNPIAARNKASSGMIKVSNGVETLTIPASDEAQARADGYQRVK